MHVLCLSGYKQYTAKEHSAHCYLRLTQGPSGNGPACADCVSTEAEAMTKSTKIHVVLGALLIAGLLAWSGDAARTSRATAPQQQADKEPSSANAMAQVAAQLLPGPEYRAEEPEYKAPHYESSHYDVDYKHDDAYKHHNYEYMYEKKHSGYDDDKYSHEVPDKYEQYTKQQDKYSHYRPVSDSYKRDYRSADPKYEHAYEKDGPYGHSDKLGYQVPNDPSYKPSYEPSYDPSHKPSYEPEHEPSYEPSYKDDYYVPSYDEKSYGKAVKEHWCFQEVSREIVDNVTMSKFRCCGPQDAVDVCLYNSTHPDHEYHSHQDHTLLETLNPTSAATCSWESFEGGCPEEAMETCVACGTLNCSLSSAAAECGCPKTFSFTASGYIVTEAAASCEPYYDLNPHAIRRSRWGNSMNVTGLVNTGDAWIFKGKFHLGDSYDGYKESKGYVELIPAFGNAPDQTDGRKLLSIPTAAPTKPVSADKASASNVIVPQHPDSYPQPIVLVKGGSLNIVLFDEEY